MDRKISPRDISREQFETIRGLLEQTRHKAVQPLDSSVPGIVSDWKNGSNWQHVSPEDGKTVMVAGKVLESDSPKRLVLTWAAAANPEDDSTVEFTIDDMGGITRLVVAHGGFIPGSTMAGKVSAGWPRVLSSLKSLLETGKALDTWAGHVSACAGTAATETT